MTKFKNYINDARDELHDFAWIWVESSSFFILIINRVILLIVLKIEKRDYFENNWMFKEHMIVNCYVVLLLNLEVHFIQRNEIMHFVVKIIFNDQMSFETIFKNIRFELRKMHTFIREKKKKSRIKRFRDVNFLTFQLLFDRVIIWVMKAIKSKWMTIVAMIERINSDEENVVSKSYNCTFVVRWNLFCRHVHYLLRTILKNFSISVILLHSRWRLNDFETNIDNWQSRYYDDAMNFDFDNENINHNKSKNRFVRNTVDQQTVYERLLKEVRDVLINQVEIFTNNVTSTHDAFAKVKTEISIELSKSSLIKKKLWILKKHDKTIRKATIAIETTEKKIRKHDLTIKFLSFSTSFALRSIFKSSSTIVVSNSKNFVSKISFNLSVFIASSNNSSKRKKSKNRKNDSKSQSLLFSTNSSSSSSRESTSSSKTIRTRKMIEFKKWKSKFHQSKTRRQRNFTLKITTKEFTRKKSKTNLRNVQTKKMKNRESQQKRIVNSTFIVN